MSGGGNRAILWSPSNDLSNPFPTLNFTRIAINDLGHFVGVNRSSTGYADNGTFHSIGLIPTSLANNDIAVGASQGVGGVAAFENISILDTTPTLIGTLSGDLTSDALGINALGTEIVGISNGHGGFLYDVASGNLQSVMSLLNPADSGWSILSANSINDGGFIVGQGSFSGSNDAVLLTPTPEPTSLVLLILGAAGLFLAARRRR